MIRKCNYFSQVGILRSRSDRLCVHAEQYKIKISYARESLWQIDREAGITPKIIRVISKRSWQQRNTFDDCFGHVSFDLCRRRTLPDAFAVKFQKAAAINAAVV